MKIGINARTFGVDEPGGAVQSAKNITKVLIENTSHDIIVFGNDELSAESDFEVRKTGFHDNQMWGIIWERTILPQLAKIENIDVLYCPNGNSPPYRTSIPTVVCIHDVNAQANWSSNLHQTYRKLLVPRAARSSDQIVTVSEFSKKSIAESLNVKDSKIEVIYNGIDQVYINGESTKIELPDKYILFVGSLNPRKNISGVIKAFDLARQKEDIELVIVGPGNKSIFQNLKVDTTDGVHQMGFLEKRELKYVYEEAEGLVFPSFYEGFGLPPLESFACGTPVVSSNRSSLPEILGDHAIYVDPNSPEQIAKGIQELLSQTYSSQKLRQHAMEYTWESVAKRLSRVLEDAAQ